MQKFDSESTTLDDAWWESGWFALLLVFAAAIPLLWPTVPPLVDYPGHLGRYRVEIGVAESSDLARYYSFDWSLIGNLGLDLLIIPLHHVFGLELAGKILVIAIPVLTVAGIIAVAREVHGRLPPYAIFAVPFAYSYPFQFGFVNSCFSIAFALLAFALWLRLGRLGCYRLRAGVFVFLSSLIWLTHTVGWGVLGLLCGPAELLAPARRGVPWRRRLPDAVLACLPLAPPFALMLLWRGGDVGGQTVDWFNWRLKWRWIYSALREQDQLWDIVSMATAATAIMAGWARLPSGIAWRLAFAAMALTAAFLVMPRIVIGSNYADMRLAPVIMILLLLTIRPLKSRRWATIVAIAGTVFSAARLGVTTIVYARYDAAHARQLKALDHVRQGERILALVGMPCGPGWYSTRLEHIPSLAIVRRDAFVNDQWVMAGAQLLNVRYTAAAPYTHDPSQMVPVNGICPREPQRTIRYTLTHFPRAAFDYLWLMNIPRHYWPDERQLVPIYHNRNGVLYRIVKRDHD